MSKKILYLSRIYPNNIVAVNGLWVEGLVTEISSINDVRVISPVPYCPPLPQSFSYARTRSILHHDTVNGIQVYRPRFLSPPGYLLHSYLGDLYYWSIVRKIDRYRKEFPFELIHAQFSYPDGYAAARLAKRYNVPLVITEHAAWVPWMDEYPRVRRQAEWAVGVSRATIAGSRYLAETISGFDVDKEKVKLIPLGINTRLFKPDSAVIKKPNQMLFVGRIHMVKGVDILFHALSMLVKKNKDIRLVLIGSSLGFKGYQVQEEKLRKLATSLGVDPYLEYVGMQPPEKVREFMQQSALLVLPSRRESFGTVVTEALACGTPVVATRCGGPEDLVNDRVGALVEKESPQALAEGLEKVLSSQHLYDAGALHAYVEDKYSWRYISKQIQQLYQKILKAY